LLIVGDTKALERDLLPGAHVGHTMDKTHAAATEQPLYAISTRDEHSGLCR